MKYVLNELEYERELHQFELRNRHSILAFVLNELEIIF